MGRLLVIFSLLCLVLTGGQAIITRNNALMTRMTSLFQDKGNKPTEHSVEGTKGDVVSLMQNVLCNNFPAIPCDLITKDNTLKHLIQKSIQQLDYKKADIEKTTLAPYQLTLLPVVNSEDLSNFVQINEAGYFKRPETRKKATQKMAKRYWPQDKPKTALNGRKKLRKFYPHKIKYGDKNIKNHAEYSDENQLTSVEVNNRRTDSKGKRFNYQRDPSGPPVWRIDYMKHGEPSLNMFGHGTDTLRDKITKTGPNVIVDDHVLAQAARKDVLHPDVYIKKNNFLMKHQGWNSKRYE